VPELRVVNGWPRFKVGWQRRRDVLLSFVENGSPKAVFIHLVFPVRPTRSDRFYAPESFPVVDLDEHGCPTGGNRDVTSCRRPMDVPNRYIELTDVRVHSRRGSNIVIGTNRRGFCRRAVGDFPAYRFRVRRRIADSSARFPSAVTSVIAFRGTRTGYGRKPRRTLV